MPWRRAGLVPIIEGGDKTDPQSYGPISSTSTVVGMLEDVVVDGIGEHLERHDLVCDGQRGLVGKTSCSTDILSFYSGVFETIDRGLLF